MAHKNTLMIGRSHGIHAEPVTFGLKMALWFQEMVRNRERLVRAREVISVGKIAGAWEPSPSSTPPWRPMFAGAWA